MDTFGLSKYSSIVNPRESKFINHLNGDKEFQTTRGHLQLAPTTGLVVTGNGASCNTHKVIVLGNIQSMEV